MVDVEFAYAFTAGMVAPVNPCGFAMLPAYLGFFLGSDDASRDPLGAWLRGFSCGAAVSGGFWLLFALAGALVPWSRLGVGSISPWFTVLSALLLAIARLALACGWAPALLLPRLDRGGRDRSLWWMFVP